MRGKEHSRIHRTNMCEDHPRLCGEKCHHERQPAEPGGITPAYAGKRLLERPLDTINRDHPRLCGEKAVRSEYFVQRVGSPPPMRGKEGKSIEKFQEPRITPAYAGKSSNFL